MAGSFCSFFSTSLFVLLAQFLAECQYLTGCLLPFLRRFSFLHLFFLSILVSTGFLFP